MHRRVRDLLHHVPQPIKRLGRAGLKGIRAVAAPATLATDVKKLKALGAGDVPDMRMLRELVWAWDNDRFVAQAEYLQAITEQCGRAHSVLECGSGLTTIVAAAIAGKRGVQIWSLEHHRGWYERISQTVRRLGLPNAHVVYAPLRTYQAFEWYNPPREVFSTSFDLVICDGPPGTTPGGRYGLLPVLGSRLSSDVVILLDDATRDGEREVVRKWHSDGNFEATTQAAGGREFATVTRAAQR